MFKGEWAEKGKCEIPICLPDDFITVKGIYLMKYLKTVTAKYTLGFLKYNHQNKQRFSLLRLAIPNFF